MFTGRSTGQVRLVDGSADPGGAWEYGRLEVLVNGFWSIINERPLSQDIGRRGAEVACRSLGFAAGAQLLVGKLSPFPTAEGEGVPQLLRNIICNGTEGSLSECTLEVVPSGSGAGRGAATGLQFATASLICSNPSGPLQANIDRVRCTPPIVNTCTDPDTTVSKFRPKCLDQKSENSRFTYRI